MSSTLDIINRALAEVNAPRISALDDESPYADAVAPLWVPARNYVLRAHPWPCCMARAKLNRDESTPLWEFAYAHVLPVDYAVLVEVYPQATYSIESGLILSDQEELSIKYVSTDSTLFDASLEDAIVYELASRLAMPVTSKKSLADKLEIKAKDALNRAIHTSTREQTPKNIRAHRWKDAKLGRRRTG